MLDLSTASAGHPQECARLGSAKQLNASGQGQGDCVFLFWVMVLSFLFCPICRQSRRVVLGEIRVFNNKQSLTTRAGRLSRYVPTTEQGRMAPCDICIMASTKFSQS